MKMIKIANTDLTVPQIALGCMRLNGKPRKEAEEYINTALELGLNFFDHADIYGGGECEKLFSELIGMSPSVRENVVIQSKCGIRQGFFDFSKEHILNSVDGILSRLNTDYLDILLLHRPDTLVEPEEVAEAFDELEKSGKVRHFGVSNEKPMQIELLKKYVKQPIVVNQLQLSITNANMIANGLNVNMLNDSSVDHDGSVLDYCRLNDITIQPWSPFQCGFFSGVFIDNPDYPELNKKLNEMAEKYGVTNSAMAVAWILRHPARMQPVLGTINAERVRQISKATDVDMSREDWYGIYRAAGYPLP